MEVMEALKRENCEENWEWVLFKKEIKHQKKKDECVIYMYVDI